MTQNAFDGGHRNELPWPGSGTSGGYSAAAAASASKEEFKVKMTTISPRQVTTSPSGRVSAKPAVRLPRSLVLPKSLFYAPEQMDADVDVASSAGVAASPAAAAAAAVTAAAAAAAATSVADSSSSSAVEAGEPRSPSSDFSLVNSSNISGHDMNHGDMTCDTHRRGGQKRYGRAWGARSRLPFYMLPFEVQAYHLQQQGSSTSSSKQQLHKSSYNSQHLSASNSSSGNSRSSGSSNAEFVTGSPIRTPPPSSVVSPVASPAAIAENAWFPLMPPALACEVLEEPQARLSQVDPRAITGEDPEIVTGCDESWPNFVPLDGAPPASESSSAGPASIHGEHLASSERRTRGLDGTYGTRPAHIGTLPGAGAAATASAGRCWATSDIADIVNRLAAAASEAHSAATTASTPCTSPPEEGGATPSSLASLFSPATALAEGEHRLEDSEILEPSAELEVHALTVVVASGFVEAARMQEVSLALCNSCRSAASWSLRITEAAPPQLMRHVWPAFSAHSTAYCSGTRLIPHRRITKLRIDTDRDVTGASWPFAMRELAFGAHFDRPVEGIMLPDGLEVLSFGVRFNQPVSRVRWPRSLRKLAFGNDFNQPVSGIDLPAGLRRLDFGGRFNNAVCAVDWPQELRELRFGHGFNREISSVRWPPQMVQLEFCGEFQQRVEDVAWPQNLQHLALLGDFNQPLDAIVWPRSLKALHLGDGFRQPLTNVRWPTWLETIVLGRDFDKSLERCEWPPGLRVLTIPYEHLLGGGTSRLPPACTVEVMFEGDARVFHVDCTLENGPSDSEMSDDGDRMYWDDDEEEILAERGDRGGFGDVDVFGYDESAWHVEER